MLMSFRFFSVLPAIADLSQSHWRWPRSFVLPSVRRHRTAVDNASVALPARYRVSAGVEEPFEPFSWIATDR